MAKKASLFSGGSKSASTILEKSTPENLERRVDISLEALSKRAAERTVIPHHPLSFSRTGIIATQERQVNFDFSHLIAKYPHSSVLINQILVGLSSLIFNGVSDNNLRNIYGSLEPFIEFVNQKYAKGVVGTISDIDPIVFQSYKSYLISEFPRRGCNNRIYNGLVRSCGYLRKTYPLAFDGDTAFLAPIAPRRNHKRTEGYNRKQIEVIIKCCVKDIMAIKAFHAMYDSLSDDSPQITMESAGPWRNDPDKKFIEILATIKSKWPRYPYYMSFNEVKSFFNSRIKDAEEDSFLRDRIDRNLANGSGKISFMNGDLGRGAIFAAMHFVPDTIFPFLLLSQISTGFNSECLKFLSDDFDNHIGADLIDPANYVIIWGYKRRSDKIIPVRCKKNRAFGAYRLLKYVENIITKFKDTEHYVHDLLFQFTRVTLNEPEGNLLCTFRGSSNGYNRMAISFVQRHGLESMFGKTIDARKIRSGYATIAQEKGVSTHGVAEQLGHSHAQNLPETADTHYLSDNASTDIKNKAVSAIQDRLLSDVCEFKGKIVHCKSLQQMRKAINTAKSEAERKKLISATAAETKLARSTIIHLLDAGAQTYILACEDMFNPTWPGSQDFVKGTQCRQFNKCCICRQAVVFPEALPYIAKRIMDIDKLQEVLTAPEWSLNYHDEHKAWSSILNDWNNETQVADAWEAARSGNVFLPKVMKGGVK